MTTLAAILGVFTIICCFSNIVCWLSRFFPAGQWQPIVDAAKEGRVRLHKSGQSFIYPRITQARVDNGPFITVPGHIYMKCQAIQEEHRKAYIKQFLEQMNKP